MRKDKAIKNIITNLFYYCINSILGLVGRKIFCDYLSTDIVGLNGLLTSIISMLSLAELGLGSAVGYQLYRPLAEHDYEKASSIICFLKKAYCVLGCFIFILGIFALPFLHIMVEGNEINMSYIYTVYFIILIDAAISYFFTYRRILLISDQNEFKVKRIDILVLVFTVTLQCLVLVKTKNYIFYLIVRLVCVLIGNICIHIYAGKEYSFIKDKHALRMDKGDKKILVNDVKALFVMRIAIYCVSGTDNLLLSFFAGLEAVAIYSNYSLIILAVTNIFGNIFASITANLGNYIITEDNNKVYILYKKIFFANFVIATYLAVSMITVFNNFIQVWVGENYLWSIGIVAILVLNNYLSMMRKSTEAFRCAAGLFSPRPLLKYVTLLEGFVNVVASIILVKVFGLEISGIFLGTSISTLISTVIVPWIVYRYLFKKNLIEYFTYFLKYLVVTIFLASLSYFIMNKIGTGIQVVNVLLAIVISCITTFVGIILLYGKNDEFKYWKELIFSKIRG